METRPRIWRYAGVALVVGAALAGRLLFTFTRGPLLVDEITYARCAANLLAGRGFVVPLLGFDLRLFLPPGYPVFLAPFVAAFGPETLPRVVGAAQALLSLATAGLVYATARRLAGGLAGAVAGAAYALHPYPAFYASRVLTETLALFLFALFLFLYLDKNAGRAKIASAFGILALAVLTRSAFLFIGLAAGACLLFRSREEPWRRRGGNVAAAALAFALVLAPWALRNTSLAGRPVLITSSAGKLLYEGNVSLSREAEPLRVHDLRHTEEFRSRAAPLAGDPVAQELAFQDFAGEKARAIIAGNPAGFLRLSAWRLAHTFSFYPTLMPEIARKNCLLTLSLPFVAAFTALLYLAAAAGIFAAPSRLAKIFIPAAIVANTAVHVVTISLLRYRLPVDLLLTLAAGLGVAFLREKWRSRPRGGGEAS